jgi:MerR family transcriptional regulator, mercuric resistance operon regulatory protein
VNSATTYTIGKLADAAGVNVETIRYYHRQEMVNEPVKPKQGYRLYTRDHLDQIRFIKKAQTLGFTLSEIRQLLSLSDGSCSEIRSLAEAKLQTIQTKLANLSRLENVLSELVDACDANANPDHCPIIESLVDSFGE